MRRRQPLTLGRPALSVGLGSVVTLNAGGGAPVYPDEAEATAFFARAPGITAEQKPLYNTLFFNLKDCGAYAKMAGLKILAHTDQATALIDLINATYDGTIVGSPTFTPLKGFSSSGNSHYVLDGFDPVVANDKFARDNAHFAFWPIDNGGGGGAVAGNDNTRMGSAAGSGRINAGSTVVFGPLGGFDHYMMTRSGASLWEGYFAGLDTGGGTTGSIAMTSQKFRICQGYTGGGFGTQSIGAFHYGSNLSAIEALAVREAIHDLLQGLGAIA